MSDPVTRGTGAPQPSGGGATGITSKKRSRVWGLLSGLLALAMVVGGGLWFWRSAQPHDQAAPMPKVSSQAAAPGQKPDGVTSSLSVAEAAKDHTKVKVHHADDGSGGDGTWTTNDGGDGLDTGNGSLWRRITGTNHSGGPNDTGNAVSDVSTADMAPMTVFVPALGIYAPVRAGDSFGASRYKGFDTLKIPSNPRHLVWYSGGTPISSNDATGASLVAGHVSYDNIYGALYNLSDARPGEVVWTRGADGSYKKWMISRVFSTLHTEFPLEYWNEKSDGHGGVTSYKPGRELALVTCGGPVINHHLRYNIFAVATPAA